MQRRFYTSKAMHRVFAFINAWVDLASALVSVLTLGLYWPSWVMYIRIWQLEKQTKERKRIRNDQD